jgi:hypothetical protein
MKGWTLRRTVRVGIELVAALLVAAIVSTLTIDLGPVLRRQAERAGSNQIRRPLHIGRLSIRLLTGDFVVEDLLIEGLRPGDQPFFKARKIVVSMPWWTAFRGDLLIESVEMSDWEMVVETFANGRHNFPRLTGEPRQPGPRRFTTTVQYVRANRGQFSYYDHGAPWSTVARNLDVAIVKRGEYRGQASFSDGTVQIQSYLPMPADMRTRFTIVDGKIQLEHIDLTTHGSRSIVTGVVDLRRWPEQTYQVRSRVDFPTMKGIFFARDRFTVAGEGDFEGTFRLFRGGFELKGAFQTPVAGVNALRFPDLRGALIWEPGRFAVTDASADLYGGAARFSYSMAPLRRPGVRAIARFDAEYADVDLAQFTDFLELPALRLAGRATGRNLLEWPLGRFADRRGEGEMRLEPPPGVRLLGRTLPPDLVAEEDRLEPEAGPFDPTLRVGYVPVGGEIGYALDPEWVTIARGQIATPKTFVDFSGRTAYGQRSGIDFHVTSLDWQDSDRVFAATRTAFGSPTRAIQVGGRGEFDGRLTGAFARPRIEGRFAGERVRAWNVTWGAATGHVVIEDAYANVTGGVVREGSSEIHVEGRFSLGFPRRDGGEEMDARVRVVKRPVADLRLAFELQDYPVEGLLSGEFHAYDRYTAPQGFGRVTIEQGIAFDEPFETAEAGVRFEGNGVRLDGLDIRKGGGTITGAAFVGWNGTYSFNADGRRVPLESVAFATYPRAPLSGLLQFSASGAATFDSPRYDIRARIDDLFVSDEGIGQVTGRLGVRGDLMTVEVEAASPRLAVSGNGRIALTEAADADLTFRFNDTSLDPYVRAFEPRLSPFTTAVASGTLRVVGELGNVDQLLVDGRVEQVDLRLFDYRLRNDGPIQVALDRNAVRIDRLRLTGEGTALELGGQIGLHDERIALRATGDANLGILQGFFRDIRSSGAAEVVAQIEGPLRAPVLSGNASITNGRLRHFALPHSLEALNGRIAFDEGGVRLVDVTGRVGDGTVRLGGRIGLRGYLPDQFALTAFGEQMRVRYPEGFRSVIDADLTLRGTLAEPVLAGSVVVHDAVWVRRFDAGTGLLGLAAGGAAAAPRVAQRETVPLRFDVRIVARSTLRIDNNAMRVVASADLTLRGTYDRPLLFGRADIERGEALFEGQRYLVTRGTIDFANPTRIAPFFDIEAETRARVPGQTYRVTFHIAGTGDRFTYELASDPPLAEVDILALLFGDVRDPRDAELRALTPDATERELIQARALRLLGSPISGEVGRVVEQTFGVDTVQITPSLGDSEISSQQSGRLNPGARLTIGKRISDRVFLTFSRALTSSRRDEIILLEYNQSDTLAWVMSKNEDRTYALDFRVRRVF